MLNENSEEIPAQFLNYIMYRCKDFTINLGSIIKEKQTPSCERSTPNRYLLGVNLYKINS